MTMTPLVKISLFEYGMNTMRTGSLVNLLNSAKREEESPRNYIGASIIGHDCIRHIWYDYHKPIEVQGIELFTSEQLRVFNIGKVLEKMIIELLIKSGLAIVEPAPENHHLLFFNSEVPEFRGHCDALIAPSAYILEIKTAKQESFREFEKKGLYGWNKQYYAQIQSYMGMSGIHQAFILVINKNNGVVLDEMVKFDPIFYEELITKAQIIKEATEVPPRINKSPLFYKCKMCKYKKACHE